MSRFLIPLLRPADLENGAATELIDERLTPLVKNLNGLEKLSVERQIEGPMTFNTKREGGFVFAGMFTIDGSSRQDVEALFREIRGLGLELYAYEVAPDLPLDYEQTWPVGEDSPGARQLSFLRKKPGLDDERFIHHWYQIHGPLAMKIHPLYRYDRNRVLERLTQESPDFQGIVGLHFRQLEDITEPIRLYGGDPANMKIIMDDVQQFIDLPTMMIGVTRERLLV